MKLIFPKDPHEQQADGVYWHEAQAAYGAGFEQVLVDYDELLAQNMARAVRDIPYHETETPALYRGWFLTLAQYEALYEALLSRGLRLLHDPQTYALCQHLPLHLETIKAHTPRTVWLELERKPVNYDALMTLLLPFGGGAMMVRDYARSAKYSWADACYIASSSNRFHLERTVNRLREIYPKLEGGLVFREYIELATLAETAPQYAPLVHEYRLVFFGGALIGTWHYWDVEGAVPQLPDLTPFISLMTDFPARLVTMDIAQKADGSWLVLHLGDGQVSPMPVQARYETSETYTARVNSFYHALKPLLMG